MKTIPIKVSESVHRALLVLMALACLLLSPPPARANDAIHHHRYVRGEEIRYDYEDTDIAFVAAARDGTVRAGEPEIVQEIHIPVRIDVLTGGKDPLRRLAILPSAAYRRAPPAGLSSAPFQALGVVDPAIPREFSYTYRDDTDALDRMQQIFAPLLKRKLGSFLFFKMEDVHQMQESVEKIPAGMLPGQVRSTPGHEREGLGGKFIAGPAYLIYESVGTCNGTRAAFLKADNPGNEFRPSGDAALKVFTDFSFTVHVALAGPARGLLLYGEGQESATVMKKDRTGTFHPQAILQRQFSIRLSGIRR